MSTRKRLMIVLVLSTAISAGLAGAVMAVTAPRPPALPAAACSWHATAGQALTLDHPAACRAYMRQHRIPPACVWNVAVSPFFVAACENELRLRRQE